MKLDSITAHIRLRTPWEAADLGFALVQHNARWIFPAWTLLLFSLVLILWLLIPADYRMYIPWLVWWLKPLFDRVLLHILSHQMFDQRLSTADIFSAIPRLFHTTGLLGGLIWRRLSFSRGFNLSIWQLEQLRGKARSDRQHLLHVQAHSHAVWITLGCILLELVVLFSLYALILLLDPTDGSWDYISSAFDDMAETEERLWGTLIYVCLYTLSVWLIEPLYVAASFSLYLNRRTQLEAWDIELAFRNLGDRLRTLAQAPLAMVLAILLVITASSLSTPPALAEDTSESLAETRLPPEEAQTQIDAIMQREEFAQMRTVTRWERINKENALEKNKSYSIPEALQVLFANLLKILLWIAVIVMVVLAFVYRRQLLALLKPLQRKPEQKPTPDILFGMDIRPESLPDDIAAASRRLWEAGQQREALSLLYRGALMRLTRHDRLPVQDSHTEGDILQLAAMHITPHRATWLRAVTRAWQEIAYAHRSPATALVEPLFDGWAGFIHVPPAESVTGGNPA